jgi:hypothetical protein
MVEISECILIHPRLFCSSSSFSASSLCCFLSLCAANFRTNFRCLRFNENNPEDSLHGAYVNGADDNEGTLVSTKIVPESRDKVSFIL